MNSILRQFFGTICSRAVHASLLFLLFGAAIIAATPPAQTSAQWWQKEPLRLVDIVTSLGNVDSIAPAELADWKAANGYNSEHLEIMQLRGGLDDQEFYFKTSAAGKVNRDFLREYMPEAHRRGIKVMIYFNVHWYTSAFGEKHPDWRQIREDGKPLDKVYNNGTDFCLNTPWREWCFGILRDLAAYGIDGIFYDGPVYRADTCYCGSCREKYRTQHQEEMPSKSKRQGAAFKRLLEFQAASMADFLRESNHILKSVNPGIAFYMNGGVRGGNWATGRINRTLVEHQDLLGSEGGFIYSDLTRIPLWKPGLTARMLETQAGGKPTVIFTAAAHKPWTFSLLPEPELRLLYADSIANGASVWMGITQFDLKQPEMKAVTEMNRFLADNARYYTGSKSAANVAIVWSETTANHYASSPAQMIDIDRVAAGAVGNVDVEFNGMSEALLRAHVPFNVIDDVALEREPLDRYAAIFLPNVACMSAAIAARLKAYVERGGNLFATFETSLYDETGIRRSDFALAELFGVEDGKKIAGPSRWDFMKPVVQRWMLDGIAKELLSASTYHVVVRPTAADVVLRFTKPLTGPYDGIPDLSPDPALVETVMGKGKVIYFSGDFGSMVAGFHLPEYLRIAANVARGFAPAVVRLENAPASVEVVWRALAEKRLLHLVNFTGEMTRPITRVLPLRDVEITVVNGGTFRKAHTLVSKQSLSLRQENNGRAVVTLPHLAEYEVVVFEQ